MNSNKDKYDEAIEYLNANPDDIRIAWGAPMFHPAGCLFEYASPSGETDVGVGCLTMIKGNSRFSVYKVDGIHKELTEAIRADDRIPDLSCDITLNDLPVFAEWQRRLDKEIRNVKNTAL